jgi:hypothetical protein
VNDNDDAIEAASMHVMHLVDDHLDAIKDDENEPLYIARCARCGQGRPVGRQPGAA